MVKFDQTYRKEVNITQPYIQGETEDEVRRKYHLDKVVKLGSNENPYAPYYHSKNAMIHSISTLNRYPEDDFVNMKKLLADETGLKPENVALGSGAGNIIETISKMFINEGDEVLIAKQSYRLYREVSKLMGAKVIEIPLTADYQFDLDQFEQKITDKTKLIWICNPNNPTGTITDASKLEAFMDHVPENVWVIVDEAYAQFADHLSLANFIRYIGHKRVMVVRTFSKFYGLAGARLGYVLSDPEAIQAYDTVTEPFNTNRTAIAGAAAAMQFDKAEIDKTLKKILGDREGLVESLGLLGFTVAPSQANFVFAKLPEGAPDATTVVDELMKQGVIIRDCTPWGYPHHIRVTVGTHKELEFFLSKLTAVLAN
ncbi:histidinol-phosphate transaminase [Lentilactobacillus sunkii]|uniref:Histidinol-phosphate aminotransferase n=3 Tax=Lentilactobacillus TaxID=2767893 RepID=A0A0R1L2N9_9LACO|nr:histidinol-phosphate transaminase [Lentilactobacillus sunkii]KRK86586.1 histidinol-phosphate aminotransferase [Lentilactobacillus sunkii DSM 19904]